MTIEGPDQRSAAPHVLYRSKDELTQGIPKVVFT
jgi:hypothetical protein